MYIIERREMGKIIDLTDKRNSLARKAYIVQQEAKKQKLIEGLGEPKSNFFRVSHRMISLPDFKALQPFVKVVYFSLCASRNRYQRQKAYFTRSLNLLMKDTGLSKPTVIKAINILTEARFIITAKRRSGRRTRFQIVELEPRIKFLSG